MDDAVFDRVAALRPDQPGQAASGAIIGTGALAVLTDAGSKRARHADIECAAIAVGHDVNPAAKSSAIHVAIQEGSTGPGQARADE